MSFPNTYTIVKSKHQSFKPMPKDHRHTLPTHWLADQHGDWSVLSHPRLTDHQHADWSVVYHPGITDHEVVFSESETVTSKYLSDFLVSERTVSEAVVTERMVVKGIFSEPIEFETVTSKTVISKGKVPQHAVSYLHPPASVSDLDESMVYYPALSTPAETGVGVSQPAFEIPAEPESFSAKPLPQSKSELSGYPLKTKAGAHIAVSSKSAKFSEASNSPLRMRGGCGDCWDCLCTFFRFITCQEFDDPDSWEMLT